MVNIQEPCLINATVGKNATKSRLDDGLAQKCVGLVVQQRTSKTAFRVRDLILEEQIRSPPAIFGSDNINIERGRKRSPKGFELRASEQWGVGARHRNSYTPIHGEPTSLTATARFNAVP